MYVCWRLGGLAQPGNRFVSFVRACVRACEAAFCNLGQTALRRPTAAAAAARQFGGRVTARHQTL